MTPSSGVFSAGLKRFGVLVFFVMFLPVPDEPLLGCFRGDPLLNFKTYIGVVLCLVIFRRCDNPEQCHVQPSCVFSYFSLFLL